MTKNRNVGIDVLRSFGFLLIILAHVEAPDFLKVLRCFDVPLMIFVSGLCYCGKKNISNINFYKRRILRLLFPTWLFLTALFSIKSLIMRTIDAEVVVKSFLLFYNGSIGYVWIVKVFLLIMFATPVLINLVSNCSRKVVYLLIIGLLLVEEIIVNTICGESLYFDEIVPYLLGYAGFFVFGLLTNRLERKEEKRQLVIIFGVCVFALIIWYIVYGNLRIIDYKYPPSFLYIMYGYMMCLLLWYLRSWYLINPTGWFSDLLLKYLVFIGQNTLWLYLWHIPFVLISNHFMDQWYVKYILVLLCCSFVMVVQYKLVVRHRQKTGNKSGLSYFLG